VTLEPILVLLGVVTFAVTGALVGVRKRFDLVGVLILAGVTAVGGGSIRDLVVGTIPPGVLVDETLIVVPLVTGAVVFLVHRWLSGEGMLLYVSDTASLALFAALGAERGLSVGLGFWGTVLTGVISGIGGGIIRDVLSGEVPVVLYRAGDMYASAAAAGAAATYLLAPVGGQLALLAGVGVTLVARVGGRLIGLQLPVPRDPRDAAS
jgi:uncharacterized membrane protein YeiH